MLKLRFVVVFFLLAYLAGCAGMQAAEVAQETAQANLKDASQINVELGVGYIKRRQYNIARGKLEKAIKQNPGNANAYKNLAYLYSILGLKDKAIKEYEKALDLKPHDSDLLNFYGAFLCSVNKVDKALVMFKQAYSDPFYRSAYLAESNAGSCYIKQKKYKEAEVLLRRSLRVQPKLPSSLLSMADIGIKTGRYLMARAYIERYLALRKPTPASLWIQFQAEKALGSKEYYMKYARQLIRDFPDSNEAGWVEAKMRHEQFR